MPYKVYWDNGNDACGTFPEVYDTEEEAEAAAADIFRENCAQGIWLEEEEASTEAVEV